MSPTPFERNPSPQWDDLVPGTRWFRADLHVHTLDDGPGKRVKRPPGLRGESTDPAVLREYARRLLQAAIARDVQVLGLTPHNVRTGPETSSVWTIVDVWNTEDDDDGTPFRDKIRAVFPGFEPSLNVGSRGVHLLFLFDPEIGRDRYLRLFDAIMGGVSPWDAGELRMSSLGPEEVFKRLDDVHAREGRGSAVPPTSRWNYLVLAPHALADAGLFGGLKSQVLQQFPSDRLSAIELGDNQTPADATAGREWLRPSMERLRHAFYHASDAYGIASDPAADDLFEVGSRTTLLKLSSPRIEALRQAFLGRESRLRLMYEKDEAGRFVSRADLPLACPTGPRARPWLRKIEVRGGTSFLKDQEFRLSPDLTCIIGGSMTGKSTLLDGLRWLMLGEQGLPNHQTSVRRSVEQRARERFLSGNPTVTLQSPAGDASRPVAERFGMRFFSQGELKSLADDADGIEHLLFHLVPGRAATLVDQREQLRDLDQQLAACAGKLSGVRDRVAEAEQAFERAQQARTAMQRFAKAGAAALPPAEQDKARSREFNRVVARHADAAQDLADALGLLESPRFEAAQLTETLDAAPGTHALLAAARRHTAGLVQTLSALHTKAKEIDDAASKRHTKLVADVQAALVAAGGSAEDLSAFDAYAKAAQHYDSFKAALDAKVADVRREQQRFSDLRSRREALVAAHRAAVAETCQEIGDDPGSRIRVEVAEEARSDRLQEWVTGLRKRGISRWWNDGACRTAKASGFHPVLEAVAQGEERTARAAAAALGMSPAVTGTLLEVLASASRRLELWAVRCPDRYRIQWIEDGSAKDLDDLSGGRKVAVLLSLLLASDDPTPLVVDQPEDELDNRFLNETIVPALHRLKGKRQVIFATHNANIVVNGDADQVIALEADARNGRVYVEGAIEVDAVRAAILRTLDGGEEAFGLRRAKYGF